MKKSLLVVACSISFLSFNAHASKCQYGHQAKYQNHTPISELEALAKYEVDPQLLAMLKKHEESTVDPQPLTFN